MDSIIDLTKTPKDQISRKKRFLSPGIILIALAIAVIFTAFTYLWQEPQILITKESPEKEIEKVSIKKLDSEKYWAVFLTNEQVYFGHLENLDTDYPKLTDIYYFVLKDPLQGQLQDEERKVEPGLVKLGSEIHGPVDSMIINKDHILFVEQLKDDSKVVKAIEQYKRGKNLNY